MEQQQQLQGPHWSWMNLLDLSRNLTKPYVDAEQERERIRLGKIQTQVQGLSFMQIANAIAAGNLALRQEVKKDMLPNFSEMRKVVYPVLENLGTINVDGASPEEVATLKENFLIGAPFVQDNKVFFDIADKNTKGHVVRIVLEKGASGFTINKLWGSEATSRSFRDTYAPNNLLDKDVLQWLKESKDTLISAFEDLATQPQAMFEKEQEGLIEKHIDKSASDSANALDFIYNITK